MRRMVIVPCSYCEQLFNPASPLAPAAPYHSQQHACPSNNNKTTTIPDHANECVPAGGSETSRCNGVIEFAEDYCALFRLPSVR